ncbi:MAG: hypothetical protein EPN20_20325 [Magnetospirillum sp.]|nr:MAG: hypothetical protein EPN20_20325 [Magnetospirillum sp.]
MDSGGSSSSSSQSTAANETNVTTTSNVQVQNILDAAPLVGPIQNLTDALTGVTTQKAKASEDLSATVQAVADKATVAMDKAGKDNLIIAAMALAVAYYGGRR